MDRVDLMMGDTCNTNCIFCYHHGMDQGRYDFSVEKMHKVLEMGREKGFSEVYISGGEPTISPDLASVIHSARKLGFASVKVMTNGLRLSYRHYLDRLAASGLNQIAFSLHGATAKMHDLHTGMKGSYDLIVKAIKQSLSVARVEINSVVTRHNILEMRDIAGFARRHGIEHIHFQLIVPNSAANRELFPERDDIIREFKAVADLGLVKDTDFAFVPYCYIPGYEGFINDLDVKSEFFTNAPEMFENWRNSIMENKVVKDECRNCKRFRYCRGDWKV